MSADEKMVVFDDEPFNAYLDEIVENSLLKGYKNNPQKYQKQVDEWEKERGRKIGEPTPEELKLRELGKQMGAGRQEERE